MSQYATGSIDPASHLTELRTESVPEAQRIAFWRDSVLRRISLLPDPEAGRRFAGRLRRIAGPGVELIEHATSPVIAERSAARVRRDGIDEISIDVMQSCSEARMEHGGTNSIAPGTLTVVDYARPIRIVRSRHRAVGVFLPRSRVREAVGDAADRLAGRCLPSSGITTLLRAHLRLVFAEAPHLSALELDAAGRAAGEMALAALQIAARVEVDTDRFGEGLYAAACKLIRHHHADPLLSPEHVTRGLGCSRAALYRVFARHDRSVAAAIWSARLDAAWLGLTGPGSAAIPIGEIAWRSGFPDQATFNRMFKRRFGLTPGKAREAGLV